MPILNPMVAGDVPYPQYSVTTTEPISDTLVILKGVVYTKDAAGRLIVVAATLDNGIYQAKATPLSPAVAADDDEVQTLGPRTRMIFDDAVGGLVPGEDVIVVANTTNIVTGAKSSDLYIGKVFEIYTRNTDSTKKIVSVATDKIVVETVQA
jgi:hypothetical protein